MKKEKMYLATSIILLILVSSSIVVGLTPLPTWFLSAPPVSAFDYYVGQYVNGTYYCETGSWQAWQNSDDANVTFASVLTEGNTVYVSNGDYSFVDLGVLPENIALTIDANATGISYTVSPGDYVLDNLNHVLYVNGTLIDAGLDGTNGTNGTDGTNGVNGNNGLMTCSYFVNTFTNATNTYFQAIRGNDSQIVFTSTSLVSGCLQPVQDLLTTGGRIYVKSMNNAKVWDSTLSITNNGVILMSDSLSFSTLSGADFQAVDNLNAPMIYISGIKNAIYDLTLNGNKAGQSAGNWYGIHINSTSACDLHLENIYVTYTKGIGVYAQVCGNSIFTNVLTEYSDSDGFKIGSGGSLSGCTFIGCSAWANTGYGWQIFTNGGSNRFIGCHSEANTLSGWLIQDSSGNVYSGCSSHINGQNGFWIYGNSDNNRFEACNSVNDGQTTTNTYDGFKISSYSTNYATNNYFSVTVTSNTAKVLKYGVDEIGATQDYNLYNGIQAIGAGTANIILSGTNSKISGGSYNGTVYIPPATS